MFHPTNDTIYVSHFFPHEFIIWFKTIQVKLVSKWGLKKTGMDSREQVWKRVWKMTFFDLKQGQNLENWAAHLHQDFQGVTQSPPPPTRGWTLLPSGMCF